MALKVTGTVDLYGEDALNDALDYAINGILTDFCEDAAEYAALLARVDTGFYQSHIVGRGPNSPPTPPALEVLFSQYQTGPRSYYAPGLDGTGKDEGYIAAQAEYSQWLELADNTLYRGFEQAVSRLDIIARKYRI